MIGHEARLRETNLRGWIPLCQCGWIGGVIGIPGANENGKPPRPRRVELAKAIALDAHAIHLHEVRADIARQSDLALAAHGRLVDKVNETLQDRGRYGHS